MQTDRARAMDGVPAVARVVARSRPPRPRRRSGRGTGGGRGDIRPRTAAQDPCWEGLAAKTIGLTHLAEGEHETALEWMKNAGTLCRRVTDSYIWIEVDAFLAEAQAALEVGDTERAEAVARRAVEVAARGSLDGLMDRALRLLDAAA